MAEETFVNPYNFIPLTREKKLAVLEEERNLTGVIEYSVLTKTPLFIPNTSNDRAFSVDREGLTDEERTGIEEHKSYDFFSYTNLEPDRQEEKDHSAIFQRPVIPGSEIRGMFRSNYEILTESCLSAVDDEAVLSKRTAERFRPGLLRKKQDGTYELLEAIDYLWRTKGENSTEEDLSRGWRDDKSEFWKRECYKQKYFHEGQEVWFDDMMSGGRSKRAKPLAGKVSGKKEGRTCSGYIIKGEKGPGLNKKETKHCCHIFQPKNKVVKSDVDLRVLEAALKEYHKNGVSEYKEYREEFGKFKNSRKETMFPVYYSCLNDYLMLSPACITREIYQHCLKDLLRKFNSCTDKSRLCQACSLFGMVKNKNAVASRIRFTDLLPAEAEDDRAYYDDSITLSPLSSPKINNMEFYLKRPDSAWFWTYDYYFDGDGIMHYLVPEIAGRKFYWHQIDVSLPKGLPKGKLNMTVRPVKRGVVFTGKLYFHRISRVELDKLIWLLNTGETGSLESKHHGYKLGAAKPLGLGSIAVSVDKVVLRKLELGESSIVRGGKAYEWSCDDELFAKEVVSNYQKMTSFDIVKGKHVSYPVAVENMKENKAVIEGYDWFTKNHKGYDRKKKKKGDPKSRTEMYYEEHMVPMEPALFTVRKKEMGTAVEEKRKPNEKRCSNIPNHVGLNEKVSGKIEEIKLDKNGIRYAIVRFDKPFSLNGKKYYKGNMFRIKDDVKKGQQVQVQICEVSERGVAVSI